MSTAPRKIRIALAAVFLVGITLLFCGIGGQWWGWMAKLQFLPSCLALNVAGIAAVLLLTLLVGRIYCSVICPMGVFQDFVRAVKRAFTPKNKRNRGHYIAEHKWVRYGVLVLTVVSALTFSQMLLTVLAPYSAYGRMVRSIVGLAGGDSMTPALLITAGITFVVIVLCACLWGREYCNTVCPVGTTLSLLSRFSLMKVTIDKSKCVSCRKCERLCKASCIDIGTHEIDHSRCVDCFDCLGTCPKDAIHFRRSWGKAAEATETAAKTAKAEDAPSDKGRRNFIATSAALGAGIALHAQNKRLDGGLAEVVAKENPERRERLVPFGAAGVKDFYTRCTACQLCVSNCPNGVLRPSTDLEHFLKPQMGYDKGYCRPECVACSHVCPAGAIRPIEKEEKFTTRIGTARVNLDLCLAAKGEAGCGNCARHCPMGAIRMVESEGYSHRIPTVAEEQCVGCGACENLCPSRPISAITVDGLAIHIHKN